MVGLENPRERRIAIRDLEKRTGGPKTYWGSDSTNRRRDSDSEIVIVRVPEMSRNIKTLKVL